jgi:hypothetical protein
VGSSTIVVGDVGDGVAIRAEVGSLVGAVPAAGR